MSTQRVRRTRRAVGSSRRSGADVGPTKGALTRRLILDAAIARFGREGYRATSVADVARDASVSGSLAYAYFPSKEALFFAAVDEDAAAVIREGVDTIIDSGDVREWRRTLIFALMGALEHHPLARRLLGGLEPEVTERVLGIPALAELRKACAERLRTEQLRGFVRRDIDPVVTANGLVAIMLSMLMSVVQIGLTAVDLYGEDIAAVLGAAIEVPADRG
jgi:AcrR family transcriptional regulator